MKTTTLPAPSSRSDAFAAGKADALAYRSAAYPFAAHRDASEDEELRGAYFSGHSEGRSIIADREA
jgi:hypothetical protein